MALEKGVILKAGLIGLDEKGPNENSRQYCLRDSWRQGLSSYRLLCEGRQEYSLIGNGWEYAVFYAGILDI
jgi:hypothetical protein